MAKKFEMPSVENDNQEEVITLHQYKKEKVKKEGAHPLDVADEEDLIELGEWKEPRKKKNDKAGNDAEDEEIEDARRELKERLDALKAKGKKPKVDAPGEIDTVNKKERAVDSAEKVSSDEEKELAELFKKEEPVYELTKKKNNFNPEKMSLDELDDRVQELWGAMDKILKDAGGFKPTKEEKSKLKKFVKKGGEWPLDDAVTAENYKKRLEKYGIAEYINPSLIEKDRDIYAVVSKQYGIYRDALEKRIRKAKLKQLEEAEGKPSSKKEKQERIKDVELRIEAELPPKGEGMPWELKRELGEEIEKQDGDILETENSDAAQMEEIREKLDEPEKLIKKKKEKLVVEKYFKIGDKVRAGNIDGKAEAGWRVDGFDKHGRVKIFRKKLLRKPERQLISEEELKALNP